MPVEQINDRVLSQDRNGCVAAIADTRQALSKCRFRGRSAFTLIEMLVALSIVLFLGAITVAFLPKVQEKQRVARGASLLQGWLATAKNLAIRDNAPRGVRIQGSLNSTSKLVTSCQYIEQPDDLFQGGSISISGGTGYDATSTAPDGIANSYTYTVTGVGVDFCGGFRGPGDTGYDNVNDPPKWPIQAGDYLEVPALTPPVLKFIQVSGNPGAVTGHLTATAQWPSSASYYDPSTYNPASPPAPAGASLPQSTYVIVRQPRVRVGAPSLDLPENIAIDVSTNSTYGSALPVNAATGNIEILFSPAGQVMGLGSGSDKIQLWLRDTSADSTANVVMTPALDPNATFQGDQVLVTVYVRTGAVAASTVNTALNGATPQQYTDPYAFTRDGRSSGL